MCKASNGLGSGISAVVYLAVKIPAHFREEFRVETVAKSSPLVITCEAIGDKPLFVSWKKDGQSFAVNPLSRVQSTLNLDTSSSSSSSSGAVISDKRYVITETISDQGLTSQIKVESADRRDSSLYTCLASNAYGSDEINLQVIVQGMYCLLSLVPSNFPACLSSFSLFACLVVWVSLSLTFVWHFLPSSLFFPVLPCLCDSSSSRCILFYSCLDSLVLLFLLHTPLSFLVNSFVFSGFCSCVCVCMFSPSQFLSRFLSSVLLPLLLLRSIHALNETMEKYNEEDEGREGKRNPEEEQR